MSLIDEIELRVDVSRWIHRGVALWPIARMNIGHAAFASEGGLSGPISRKPKPRWWWVPLRMPAKERRGLVCLGDGVSLVHIDKAWADRLCGPFVRMAQEASLSPLVLQPVIGPPGDRWEPTRFIPGLIERARIASKIIERRPGGSPPYGHDLVVSLVRAAGLSTLTLAARALREQATQVRLTASALGRFLDQSCISFAFVVDWNLTSLALHRACAERGKVSVEIQHGLVGPQHWAYAPWGRIPSGGYGELPSVFWCWSSAEAAIINSWATSTERHRAIVGGNPWIEEWLDGRGPIANNCDFRLPPAPVEGANILITLQRGLVSELELRPIIAAVEESPDDWVWWVRMHPLMEVSERADALRLLGRVRSLETLVGDDTPLLPVLGAMDAHVTHSSAAVMEAVQLGVPSVVVGEGYQSFFGGIREEMVAVASDGLTLVGALHRCLSGGGRHERPSNVDPQKTFHEIMTKV